MSTNNKLNDVMCLIGDGTCSPLLNIKFATGCKINNKDYGKFQDIDCMSLISIKIPLVIM